MELSSFFGRPQRCMNSLGIFILNAHEKASQKHSETISRALLNVRDLTELPRVAGGCRAAAVFKKCSIILSVYAMMTIKKGTCVEKSKQRYNKAAKGNQQTDYPCEY